MKINFKKSLFAFPAIFALAIIVITIVSWLGNIYDWQTNNLISANGLRWFVSNFMDNIKKGPWEYIILISFTISAIKESDILNLERNKIYLKQKRAYMFTILMGIIILFIMAALLFMSGNLLLNAFGDFGYSPLQKGIIPIVLLSVILLSCTFGYASGRFANFEETINAMVRLLADIAAYFVTFLVASQLFAITDYVLEDVPAWNDDNAFYHVVCFLVFWLPWILHVVYAYKRKP